MARSFRLDELPPELRARFGRRQARDGSKGEPRAARSMSEAGTAMAAAGRDFERDLVLGHDVYRMQRQASIVKREPGARIVGKNDDGSPKLRLVRGGDQPDFSGPARGLGGIVFDAKTVSGRATFYEHDPKQRGQLQVLLDAQACGGRGFLLIRDTERALAYLVEDAAALRALQVPGGRITLRAGRASDGSGHAFPILPKGRDGSPLLWDWLRMLRELAPPPLDPTPVMRKR